MIQVITSERYLMRTRRVDNNEFAEIRCCPSARAIWLVFRVVGQSKFPRRLTNRVCPEKVPAPLGVHYRPSGGVNEQSRTEAAPRRPEYLDRNPLPLLGPKKALLVFYWMLTNSLPVSTLLFYSRLQSAPVSDVRPALPKLWVAFIFPTAPNSPLVFNSEYHFGNYPSALNILPKPTDRFPPLLSIACAK